MAKGIRFAVQNTSFIIGSSTADATLTGAFSGNQSTFNAAGYTQLTLYIAYTGAEDGRTLSIQVEGSHDGVTFYPVASLRDDSPFTGEAASEDFIKQMSSNSTNQVRRRFVSPVADLFMRVSVKEDGSNFGTINVVKIISGA